MEYKIDIKNWKTGDVIFSYTCEDNTIKKTVEEAVKQGVCLAYADLENADLSSVNLNGANLSVANLKYANLRNADLHNTNLMYSYLINANLIGTNLSVSNLNGVDLSGANLSNANLANALLLRTNLDKAFSLDNVKGLNDQCPKTGSFIGWKKCAGNDRKRYIVKLEILEDAKRSSSTSKKCRCSKAKVLEIQNLDGTKTDVNEVYSTFDGNFKYKIGEIVEVSDFDERYWIKCSKGIHFFMSRGSAVSY